MSEIKKASKSARRLILAAAGIAVAGIANRALATTQYFTLNGSGAGLGNFNGTTQNWETADWTTNVAGGVTPSSWVSGNFPEFSGTGAAWTMNVNATETIAGMEEAVAGQTITFNGTGALSIASGQQGFFINGSGIVYNVALTGTGEMVQHGGGSIYLYGNNSGWSGGFLTTGGQATFYNNNNSFGTGTIWFNGTPGWALVTGTTNQVTIANNISLTNATSATENNFASGGTLAKPGTIYSGNVTLSSTAADFFEIQLAPASVTEFTGNITGASGLEFLAPSNGSAGASIFADATAGGSTYSGTTGIFAGVLYCGSSNTLSANSAYTVSANSTNQAVLNLQGFSQTIGSLAGSNVVSLGAAILTTGNTNSTTFSGTISGTGGGLTKVGTGTFTLSKSNADTYTGPTTVSAGTLAAGAATAFASTSAFTVNSTLNLAGFAETIGSLAGTGTVSLGTTTDGVLTTGGNSNSTVFSGLISGTGTGGGLAKIGTGTFTLSNTVSDNYKGTTSVSAGTLATGASNALSAASAFTVAAAGTVSLGGFSQTIGSLAGAGTVNLGDTTAAVLTTGSNNTSTIFSGSITGTGTGGGLIKLGTGTFSLTSTNGSTFLGDTTISAGILSIVQDNNLGGNATGNVNISAATLLGAGSFTTDRLIHLDDPASTLDASSGEVFEIDSAIDGAGGLTKGTNAGTVFLTSAANSFLGNTTINGGTLEIVDDGSLGAAGGTVNVGAGTLLSASNVASARNIFLNSVASTLDATGGNSLTLTGNISGTGGLTKGTNLGIVTLNDPGNSTYGGATTVNGGMLAAGATNVLAASSAVTVNAAGLLSLNGYDQTIGSLAGAGTVNLGDITAANLTTGGNSNSTNFSGSITGTGAGGSLIKVGSGTFSLTSTNGSTFLGDTTVSGGTLSIVQDNDLGVNATGNVNLSAATLLANGSFSTSRLIHANDPLSTIDVTSGNTLEVTSVIDGAGNLTKGTSAGTLQLDNAGNSFQNLAINGGVVSVASDGAMGSASGSVTLSAPVSGTLLSTGTFSSARTVNLNGTLNIIDVTGTNTLDLSGVVGGTGALTKGPNAGTLQLDNTNTYQGLNINGGVVSIAADASMGGASGAVTLSGGSAGATLLSTGTFSSARTVNLNGALNIIDAASGNTLTLTGTFGGSGDLTKGTNAGTLQLANPSGYTFSGNVNAFGGTLAFGTNGGSIGPVNVPGALNVSDGAVAQFLPSTTAHVLNTVNTLNLNNTGLIDLSNSDLSVNNSLSQVRSYLAQAYAGGAWTGTSGITSSVVEANPSTLSIAYVSGANTNNAALNPALTNTSAVLLRPSLIGDFNLDGKVDRFDIRQFNARNAFNDGLTTHDWADGDLNGDGKVDRFDIRILNASNNFNSGNTFVAQAQAQTLSSSVSPATGNSINNPTTVGTVGDGKPDLLYNPSTGDVVFSYDGYNPGTGKELVEIDVQSSKSDLNPSGANTSAAQFVSKASNDVDYQDVGTGIADGVDLGTIMPVGSTPAALTNGDIVVNLYLNGEGTSNKYADITSTPEPTTLSLMGLAAAGLLGRRRKNKAQPQA